ncbi:DUF406 family protein [Shewanella sp.]|uniref:DUF406 family protein n=1 Tax=Shewanella sp. TaxID=50422 RepID=UPI0035673F89
MKAIKENQNPSVNDTCTDCGSYMDIGAVISADDIHMSVTFSGECALEQARALQQKAIKRFAAVQTDISEIGHDVELKLTFDVAAEKMIFQMETGL